MLFTKQRSRRNLCSQSNKRIESQELYMNKNTFHRQRATEKKKCRKYKSRTISFLRSRWNCYFCCFCSTDPSPLNNQLKIDNNHKSKYENCIGMNKRATKQHPTTKIYHFNRRNFPNEMKWKKKKKNETKDLNREWMCGCVIASKIFSPLKYKNI